MPKIEGKEHISWGVGEIKWEISGNREYSSSKKSIILSRGGGGGTHYLKIKYN